MDKLDLDSRVSLLERRVGVLTVLLMTGGLAVAAILVLSVFVTRSSAMRPMPVATPAPSPFVMEVIPTNGPGTMGALKEKLTAIFDLQRQGMIDLMEWKAKKAKLLAEALTPGDLRSDLSAVQDLYHTQAIEEGEQKALRAKLLGIEAPESSQP